MLFREVVRALLLEAKVYSTEIAIPIKSPLVRERRPDSLAINPYFLFLCFNAICCCSAVANVALPLSHSPLGCPLMPHGTMRTFELFRKRFTLPVFVLVITYIISLSWSIVNHTGVAIGWPFLLYVSRLIYAFPESVDIQLDGEDDDDDIHNKFAVQLFLLFLSIV